MRGRRRRADRRGRGEDGEPRRPRTRPAEGARPGPSPGSPPGGRAPAHRGVGEGGARAKEGGRAGRSERQCLPRLPPTSRAAGGGAARGPGAAGRGAHLHSGGACGARSPVPAESRASQRSIAAAYTPSPSSAARPAGPASAAAAPRTPSRVAPGPRTHPPPGRRASRRGRRGGGAGLTSLWPRRGPGRRPGARPAPGARGRPAGLQFPPAVLGRGRRRRRLGQPSPAPSCGRSAAPAPPRRRSVLRGPLLPSPGLWGLRPAPWVAPSQPMTRHQLLQISWNCFSELPGRNGSSHEPSV